MSISYSNIDGNISGIINYQGHEYEYEIQNGVILCGYTKNNTNCPEMDEKTIHLFTVHINNMFMFLD